MCYRRQFSTRKTFFFSSSRPTVEKDNEHLSAYELSGSQGNEHDEMTIDSRSLRLSETARLFDLGDATRRGGSRFGAHSAVHVRVPPNRKRFDSTARTLYVLRFAIHRLF